MRLLILSFAIAASLSAVVVNYSYDTAGRLVRVDYGAGGSITYTYDKAGNLLSRITVPAAAAAPPAKKKDIKQKPESTVKK